MIKEIKITNFYSFKQETIRLQPDVNLLIGINGSGKSNFFKAINLLAQGVSDRGLKPYLLQNLGGFDAMFFKGNTGIEDKIIVLEYVFDGAALSNEGYAFTYDLVYKIRLIKHIEPLGFIVEEQLTTSDNNRTLLHFKAGTGYILENNQQQVAHTDYSAQDLAIPQITDANKYPEIVAFGKALKTIGVYDYFNTTPNSAIRKPIYINTNQTTLVNGGYNLAQVLYNIKYNHPASYEKIVAMLYEINSLYVGFDFNQAGNQIELMLIEQNLEGGIPVTNLSDGTLKYLCLMAIFYNPERGSLICIDEPETGLHPDMLNNISKAIEAASENTTLLISTHCDNILNYYNFDNLRVFEKDDNNSSKIVAYKATQFEGWYQDFIIGQMWKDGALGGVRYGA